MLMFRLGLLRQSVGGQQREEQHQQQAVEEEVVEEGRKIHLELEHLVSSLRTLVFRCSYGVLS